jgi:hypothetical protein
MSKKERKRKKTFKLPRMGTPKIPNYVAIMSSQNKISLPQKIAYSPKTRSLKRETQEKYPTKRPRKNTNLKS